MRKRCLQGAAIRCLAVWFLIGSMAPWATAAESTVPVSLQRQAKAEFDGAEKRLAAVRTALLNHALNGEVEVVTSAFVDESGELHESTYLGSNSTVRGIRITDYLEAEGQSPALAAEILDQVETQTCHASRYRRQAVLETRVSADLDLNVSMESVGQVIREALLEKFRGNEAWLVTTSQAFKNPYDKALRGTSDQFAALRVEVVLEPLKAGLLASSYYEARRALKDSMRYLPMLGYRPEPTAKVGAVRLQLRLIEVASGRVVFVDEETVKLSENLQSIGTDLALELVHVLEASAKRQFKGLEAASRCLPNTMSITSAALTPSTLQLQAGALVGVAVGDEFLLSHSRDLPAVVLNGEGINRLGLGRVTRVNDYSAVLEVVAGDRSPSAGYVVALPF